MFSKNFKRNMGVALAASTAIVAYAPTMINAEDAVEYIVPVKLMKAHEEDKYSMGNAAMVDKAKVIEKDGKAQIFITMKGLSFMNMYGHLWGMQAYENGLDSPFKDAVVEKTFMDTDLEGGKREFPQVLRIDRDKTHEDKIYIRVQVDAMDAITSGATTYDKITKGKGHQNAVIYLDYSNAQKVSGAGDNADNAGTKRAVKRIQGSDRYSTAVALSKANYDKADVVVIANGRKEADALAAAPLAALNKAPILLATTNKVPQTTMDEIVRLGAKKAIIVGGVGTVNADVEKALKDKGIAVERLAGGDRYETATVIGDKVMELSSSKKAAIVVSGANFADALAVSALANKLEAPILLTNPKQLSKASSAALEKWKVSDVTIVGGKNSVSDAAEASIKADNKKRLSGSDRYDTSIQIAKAAFGEPANIFVANGRQSADALAAGALTAKANAPIVLVNGKAMPKSLSELLAKGSVKNVFVAGGESAVSSDLFKALEK